MRIISSLFGIIIGVVFVAGGIQIALETAVPTYRSWEVMKTWQPISAQLLHVKGSPNSVEASYAFSISSVEYINTQVYVAPFKDNIGSYHYDMYQYLQGLKDKNLPVSIWYDRYNPNQSVIDRDMRWGLFALISGFCLLFIVSGFFIILAVLNSSKSRNKSYSKPSLDESRKQWQQQREESDYQGSFIDFYQKQTPAPEKRRVNRARSSAGFGSQPWLIRKEWRTNRIKTGLKKQLIVTWIFACIWLGVTSPILFVLREEINKGNYIALLGFIFPLIGLMLIKKAWLMFRQWREQGDIELEMDPFPGSIGGHVGGSLIVKNVRDFNAKYKIELQCVYHYFSDHGNRRSNRQSIKWSESGFAKNELIGNGIRLNFRFDVPEELPESDIDRKGNYYFWRVIVSSKSSAPLLNCEYIIPVFSTQLKSTAIHHDISAQAEEVRENKAMEIQAAMNSGDFSSTALSRSLVYKDIGNEQIFYYPMFRNKLLTLFSLIFAASFSFAAYSMYREMGGGSIIDIGMFVFSFAASHGERMRGLVVPSRRRSVVLSESKR